jgi:hypothetical protein
VLRILFVKFMTGLAHRLSTSEEYVRNVHSCVERGGPVSVSEAHIASDGSKYHKLVLGSKPIECYDN